MTSSAADRHTATFTDLYNAAYADMLRFAQRRVDAAHADDVVAEAFLTAWRRLGDLPASLDNARAWLFGIARGVILNTQRSAKRQRALVVRLADPLSLTAHPAEDLTAGQRADLVRGLAASHAAISHSGCSATNSKIPTTGLHRNDHDQPFLSSVWVHRAGRASEVNPER